MAASDRQFLYFVAIIVVGAVVGGGVVLLPEGGSRRESVGLYLCGQDLSPCKRMVWLNSVADCQDSKVEYGDHPGAADGVFVCLREAEFR